MFFNELTESLPLLHLLLGGCMTTSTSSLSARTVEEVELRTLRPGDHFVLVGGTGELMRVLRHRCTHDTTRSRVVDSSEHLSTLDSRRAVIKIDP